MFKQKHDKLKAVFLRRIGWSHRQIAEYLECSESWCRHELSKISPDKELIHTVAQQAYIKEVTE